MASGAAAACRVRAGHVLDRRPARRGSAMFDNLRHAFRVVADLIEKRAA